MEFRKKSHLLIILLSHEFDLLAFSGSELILMWILEGTPLDVASVFTKKIWMNYNAARYSISPTVWASFLLNLYLTFQGKWQKWSTNSVRLSYLLLWSRILLEKLTGSQLVLIFMISDSPAQPGSNLALFFFFNFFRQVVLQDSALKLATTSSFHTFCIGRLQLPTRSTVYKRH